jgi:hypothetical protein
MWQTLAKYLLKLALWCYKNRNEMDAAYTAVHVAVEDIRSARLDSPVPPVPKAVK